MNSIFYLPKEGNERIETHTGSGGYYARLSQTDTIPAPIPGGIYAIWMLEAFDAEWFDDNPEPSTLSDWTEYYERARLFILEMIVDPAQFGRFDGFKTIAQADSKGEE